MGKIKLTSKILPAILLALLLLSLGFNAYTYKYGYHSQIEKNIDFFTNYIIALKNYNMADFKFYDARLSLDYGNNYLRSEEGYFYEVAVGYYDEGKEHINNAKGYLQSSKNKLNEIRFSSPNGFYEREIKNRLKQVDSLLSLSNKLYFLLDYADKQLYEVNYGSETKAIEYSNRYKDLIIEVNDQILDFNSLSEEIDLAWHQNR